MSSNQNHEPEKKYNDSVCTNTIQKLKRLFHWAPIVALGIIFYIAATTTLCIFYLYHPFSSLFCFVHFSIYLYEFYLVLNNYLCASYLGPGFVPYGWVPKSDEDRHYLQYCELCESYKPPRSHHCRKCDRCILKMDHHCPWINTCCGHQNHGYFVYFLFFAPVGCIHSSCIIGVTLYYAIFLDFYLSVDYGAVVVMGLWESLAALFAFGLSLGVIIAVGCLWVIQMKSIVRNETGIENWIRAKYEIRDKVPNEVEFVYPYDLGWWRNLRLVLTWTGACVGDGVVWQVREGCGQYDLTMEQMKQKKDKEAHSQLYDIKKDFSGTLCPLFSFGFRVLWGSPCTDENRMAVHVGNVVKVTRWRKHWLYGQLVRGGASPNNGSCIGDRDQQSDQKKEKRIRSRGWFPSACGRISKEMMDFNHRAHFPVSCEGDSSTNSVRYRTNLTSSSN